MSFLAKLTEMTDALPGGKIRRLRRQLVRPDTYVVDLLRAKNLITSRVMFSDFRYTYSLAERKAFKVATLLEVPHLFFIRLDTRIGMPENEIPANTVLANSFLSFYTYLEEACVQPADSGFEREREWAKYPTLMPYVLDDLRTIFGDQIPSKVLAEIVRLEETHFGTKRASSPEELALWRKIATDAAWDFWDALRDRRGIRNKAYESPRFLVYEMFEEVCEQIEQLEASAHPHRTEFVRCKGQRPQ